MGNSFNCNFIVIKIIMESHQNMYPQMGQPV